MELSVLRSRAALFGRGCGERATREVLAVSTIHGGAVQRCLSLDCVEGGHSGRCFSLLVSCSRARVGADSQTSDRWIVTGLRAVWGRRRRDEVESKPSMLVSRTGAQ